MFMSVILKISLSVQTNILWYVFWFTGGYSYENITLWRKLHLRTYELLNTTTLHYLKHWLPQTLTINRNLSTLETVVS